MSRSALRVAWYRLVTAGRRRWGGYLTVLVLIGLLGGLALGATAAARRTQSSFAELAARTNSSDLYGFVGVYNPSIGLNAGYDAAVVARIAHLPYVKDVETEAGLNLDPLGLDGQILPADNGFAPNGSVDGMRFNQDRYIVTSGRMADPRRAGEFVADAATAKTFGWRLGETVSFGGFTNAQEQLPAFGTAAVPATFRVQAKLVGLVIGAENVVQDDVDATAAAIVQFTPALTAPLLSCCANDSVVGVQIDGGSRRQGAVEAEAASVLPKGLPFEFSQVSVITAKADRALKPEAIALAVFGGVAGLATLVIAAQVIGRQLRVAGDDLDVLRALGADPQMIITDGLLGIGAAVIGGALLAVAVAVGLSPSAPLGPVRPFLPTEVRADWAVFGVGVAAVIIGLGAFSVAAAYRETPHRRAGRAERTRQRSSSAAHAAAASGLPVPVVAGMRFALEPGAGRNSAPVRSAIVGAALAMIVVTATVTFGTSLNALVSHPRLYGWNWDYELNGGGGLGDIPAQKSAALLDKDPYVAGWTGIYFSTLQIDGQHVPVIGGTPQAAVGLPVLSGHGFDAADEVVLGADTLAQLHKRVGDTVVVNAGGGPSTRLRVAGTATMPAIGIGGAQHLEMGIGALLSYQLIPPGARNLFDLPDPGPNAILVRLRAGSEPAPARHSLETIITDLGAQANGGTVMAVQRPAEILDYATLGTTPALLGLALAAGAVVALGLTLIASVRRRRRDLAVLKTLGFTKRQLAATIAWQSTVAVGLGTVVGMPLGIASGRALWDLFAREIHAVPQPAVPAVTVVLIALGAFVLANVVAAIPGRIAARTPTALLLRAE